MGVSKKSKKETRKGLFKRKLKYQSSNLSKLNRTNKNLLVHKKIHFARGQQQLVLFWQ